MQQLRTKIVCTIGPSVNSKEKLLALVGAGMDVARLNFSHGTQEGHRQTIQILKEIRQELKRPLAIMLDTKGPEIRVGKLINDACTVEPGQVLTLVGTPEATSPSEIPVCPDFILSDFVTGATVLFDDGYITARVVEVSPKGPMVEVMNSGVIRSKKGINVPDVALSIPPVTKADEADIRFGCKEGVDLIAASFTCTTDQILAIRKILEEEGTPDIHIMAKIETSLGVDNFDDILQVVDSVMIARGDLGVEVPLTKVPGLQKEMIRKCYFYAKPSVIATQMLESMIRNPRPTRAEASDVANAIYDSASAVMLSGETAAGDYPIESVRMMASIVRETESQIDYEEFLSREWPKRYQDVPSSVTLAVVKTAYSAGATAIFVATRSGTAARLIARFRPKMPIIALTHTERIYQQLQAEWGVIPVLTPETGSIQDAFTNLRDWALSNKLVQHGDLIVLSAGAPYGVSGTTNMMVVESIGDVITRGEGIGRNIVHGQVAFVFNPEEVDRHSIAGKIIFITRCDEGYLPVLKLASGAILASRFDDQTSEEYLALTAEVLDVPAILRADSTVTRLKEGMEVTLDPRKGIVLAGKLENDQED